MDKTLLDDFFSWPPAYNLRISSKAKHPQLRIYQHKGLEIIVPLRQQKKLIITDLLEEKKDWIIKNLSKVKIQTLVPITNLKLLAIDQEWCIEYQHKEQAQIRHKVINKNKIKVLTIYGDTNNIERTHEWLKNWLKKLAKQHLIPWIDHLSSKHNLRYTKVSIRGQQTLWGSCNAKKHINLNYKLLFIPTKYAEHIMLHELCHTKHLNHSRNFWDLLLTLDPEARTHNKMIRHGDNFVPMIFNTF